MNAGTFEEAIVLKLVEYGETDFIVGLLTKNFGKISAFAAGAKKSKRRFGGAFDLFAHVRAELKPPRGPSSNLWRLHSVESIDVHHALRSDLARLSTAAFLAECMWAMAGEEHKEQDLFGWWKEVLIELSESKTNLAEKKYELELIRHLGYAPSFDRCVDCNTVPTERPVFFSYARGGVSCATCRKSGEGKWIDPANVKDLRGLIESFITYTLGWEPKSLKVRNEVLRGVV